jgi:hypothetical protein
MRGEFFRCERDEVKLSRFIDHIKEVGPRRIVANAGLMPVQLRFSSGLTSSDYVTREGWRLARLAHCPVHPRGGCGFASHGTYARVSPPGTRIARWYCPLAHCSFSLLPDHLAARFPGTLSEIEHVVATVEQAPSLEAAAQQLRRDDITLPSALRWVRRRLAPVRRLLTAVVGLFPHCLQGAPAHISALRTRLQCDQVLMSLRQLAAAHLHALAYPLGFLPRCVLAGEARSGFQHDMGPDPPRESR